MTERVILAAKNVDVNEMKFQIKNKIAGELITYKSIDSVINQDDFEFFKCTRIAWNTNSYTAIKNGNGNHYVAKYKPASL